MSDKTTYEVRLGRYARPDLVGVSRWYAQRHPAGEQRFFGKFAEMRDMLAHFPHAGRERTEVRAGLRSWPVYPYIVFYDVDDDHHCVTIERVLHGQMELDEDDFAALGE